LLTLAIEPSIERPSGSSTVADCPFETSDCLSAGRSTVTTRRVEVVSNTSLPGCSGAPTVACTSPILRGPGRKTIWPRSTAPVSSSPLSSCQRSTAAVVAQSHSSSISTSPSGS
jgi:hypothetical protein